MERQPLSSLRVDARARLQAQCENDNVDQSCPASRGAKLYLAAAQAQFKQGAYAAALSLSVKALNAAGTSANASSRASKGASLALAVHTCFCLGQPFKALKHASALVVLEPQDAEARSLARMATMETEYEARMRALHAACAAEGLFDIGPDLSRSVSSRSVSVNGFETILERLDDSAVTPLDPGHRVMVLAIQSLLDKLVAEEEGEREDPGEVLDQLREVAGASIDAQQIFALAKGYTAVMAFHLSHPGQVGQLLLTVGTCQLHQERCGGAASSPMGGATNSPTPAAQMQAQMETLLTVLDSKAPPLLLPRQTYQTAPAPVTWGAAAVRVRWPQLVLQRLVSAALDQQLEPRLAESAMALLAHVARDPLQRATAFVAAPTWVDHQEDCRDDGSLINNEAAAGRNEVAAWAGKAGPWIGSTMVGDHGHRSFRAGTEGGVEAVGSEGSRSSGSPMWSPQETLNAAMAAISVAGDDAGSSEEEGEADMQEGKADKEEGKADMQEGEAAKEEGEADKQEGEAAMQEGEADGQDKAAEQKDDLALLPVGANHSHNSSDHLLQHLPSINSYRAACGNEATVEQSQSCASLFPASGQSCGSLLSPTGQSCGSHMSPAAKLSHEVGLCLQLQQGVQLGDGRGLQCNGSPGMVGSYGRSPSSVLMTTLAATQSAPPEQVLPAPESVLIRLLEALASPSPEQTAGSGRLEQNLPHMSPVILHAALCILGQFCMNNHSLDLLTTPAHSRLPLPALLALRSAIHHGPPVEGGMARAGDHPVASTEGHEVARPTCCTADHLAVALIGRLCTHTSRVVLRVTASGGWENGPRSSAASSHRRATVHQLHPRIISSMMEATRLVIAGSHSCLQPEVGWNGDVRGYVPGKQATDPCSRHPGPSPSPAINDAHSPGPRSVSRPCLTACRSQGGEGEASPGLASGQPRSVSRMGVANRGGGEEGAPISRLQAEAGAASVRPRSVSRARPTHRKKRTEGNSSSGSAAGLRPRSVSRARPKESASRGRDREAAPRAGQELAGAGQTGEMAPSLLHRWLEVLTTVANTGRAAAREMDRFGMVELLEEVCTFFRTDAGLLDAAEKAWAVLALHNAAILDDITDRGRVAPLSALALHLAPPTLCLGFGSSARLTVHKGTQGSAVLAQAVLLRALDKLAQVLDKCSGGEFVRLCRADGLLNMANSLLPPVSTSASSSRASSPGRAGRSLAGCSVQGQGAGSSVPPPLRDACRCVLLGCGLRARRSANLRTDQAPRWGWFGTMRPSAVLLLETRLRAEWSAALLPSQAPSNGFHTSMVGHDAPLCSPTAPVVAVSASCGCAQSLCHTGSPPTCSTSTPTHTAHEGLNCSSTNTCEDVAAAQCSNSSPGCSLTDDSCAPATLHESTTALGSCSSANTPAQDPCTNVFQEDTSAPGLTTSTSLSCKTDVAQNHNLCPILISVSSAANINSVQDTATASSPVEPAPALLPWPVIPTEADLGAACSSCHSCDSPIASYPQCCLSPVDSHNSPGHSTASIVRTPITSIQPRTGLFSSPQCDPVSVGGHLLQDSFSPTPSSGRGAHAPDHAANRSLHVVASCKESCIGDEAIGEEHAFLTACPLVGSCASVSRMSV